MAGQDCKEPKIWNHTWSAKGHEGYGELVVPCPDPLTFFAFPDLSSTVKVPTSVLTKITPTPSAKPVTKARLL